MASPARLGHAGHATLCGQGAEADAAHAELAHVASRAAAEPAPVVEPDLELRCVLPALDGRLLRQVLPPEWHPELAEQAPGFLIAAGGGDDRHLEPAQLVDLVVVDLGEHDLLAQPE